jgi:4-amino-4-deoxy-L-arabinose transferase-like glycosyltransferase
VLHYIICTWAPLFPASPFETDAYDTYLRVVGNSYNPYWSYRNFIIDFYRLLWTVTFHADYFRAMNLFNIIFADTSIILAYLIARRLFGKRTAIIAFALMVFIIGFNAHTLIFPYTDTLSYLFITSAVYFIMCLYYAKSRQNKIIFTLLLSFSLGFGYLVKPHIVAVIATGVLVFVFNKRLNKNIVISTVLIVFIFCAVVGGYNNYLYKQISKDKAMPMFYYSFAQSLFGYNKTGEVLHEAFETEENIAVIRSDSNEIIKDVIKSRLNEIGIFGYANMLSKKAFEVMLDRYSNIYGTPGYSRIYKNNYFTDLYYKDYIVFNFFWYIVVVGVLLYFFKRKKQSCMQYFIKFYPFVILILLLFTETNTRYLVGSLPILCVAAAAGLTSSPLKPHKTVNN